ncbi:MAG: hypothetical protein QOE70_4002 [Chthoniobacter sp.]|jgi:tetratricopeptide (TPR) repeat protein|nr:hypothetical protein [Chthoniobacter sp.]
MNLRQHPSELPFADVGKALAARVPQRGWMTSALQKGRVWLLAWMLIPLLAVGEVPRSEARRLSVKELRALYRADGRIYALADFIAQLAAAFPHEDEYARLAARFGENGTRKLRALLLAGGPGVCPAMIVIDLNGPVPRLGEHFGDADQTALYWENWDAPAVVEAANLIHSVARGIRRAELVRRALLDRRMPWADALREFRSLDAEGTVPRSRLRALRETLLSSSANGAAELAALPAVDEELHRFGQELLDGDHPPPSASLPQSEAGAGNLPAGPMNLPPDLDRQAQDAAVQFARGSYREAEKIYERILTREPDNVHTLSNLAVVQLRVGKTGRAEEVLKKVIALAPDDGFAHCTLGTIYYSEQRFDEALAELGRALEIDPRNATAHNYLGITASQKGWPEAARKELETATALDPRYADAHFNLAVVLANQQPPDKPAALKAYRRARQLGGPENPALERIDK